MSTTSNKKNYLPAPFVPSADPIDGLIRTIDLNNFIRVEIEVWEGLKPGDTVLLMLGDYYASPVWTVTPGISIGDKISINLDPKLLSTEGTHSLYYHSVNAENGVETSSATTPLIVDLTPPGAYLLAPVLVANASFGLYLKARVPGYAGMEPGDVIQTICNGVQGPTYRIQPDNFTTTPVEISFTQEFLEGLFSDRIKITYHVTDRAGNRSILAQSVELTVQR